MNELENNTQLPYFPFSENIENNKDLFGNRQGIQKAYFPGGGLFWEVNYTDNKAYGIYKQYHSDGKICIECTYLQDIKQGKYKYQSDLFNVNKYYIDGFTEGESVVVNKNQKS